MSKKSNLKTYGVEKGDEIKTVGREINSAKWEHKVPPTLEIVAETQEASDPPIVMVTKGVP